MRCFPSSLVAEVVAFAGAGVEVVSFFVLQPVTASSEKHTSKQNLYEIKFLKLSYCAVIADARIV